MSPMSPTNEPLCPAPVAKFPSASPGTRKGWGCIVFDTYMNEDVAAGDALSKVSGGCTISNIRWIENGSGRYAIGFDFDNSGAGGATMKAEADECVHASGIAGSGRRLDGDGVTPNGDDVTWSF